MPRLETYPYQRLPLEKEKLTKLGESRYVTSSCDCFYNDTREDAHNVKITIIAVHISMNLLKRGHYMLLATYKVLISSFYSSSNIVDIVLLDMVFNKCQN